MEPSITLRDELEPALRARVQAAAALAAGACLAYAAARRPPLATVLAVASPPAVALVIVLWATSRVRRRRHTIALAVLVAVAAAAAVTIHAVVSAHAAAAPALLAGITLGTALAFPWGAGAQAVAVCAAVLALAASGPASTGATATAGVALAASIGVAAELGRHRRHRHRAEESERESARALREEIFLAEATAHAARELLAARTAPQVRAALCRLQTRLLRCDESLTLVRDVASGAAFVPVAADGMGAAEWRTRRSAPLTSEDPGGLLDRLARDEPLLVRDVATLLPGVHGHAVATALLGGREVIGIQLAVRRDARPFSSTEIQLARRLALTASTALAQARILEGTAHRTERGPRDRGALG